MAERTRLGVLGWPVSHSRSPAMQNAALAAAGLAGWHYQLLPVPPELFDETVRGLPASGFRGANVTIPHKHAALALADRASDRARAIGAANTLVFGDDGVTRADNTDAPALIGALQRRLDGIAGRSALVLGAGGSARAAVWALLDAGAGEVRVWNRRIERAQALCAELGGVPALEAGPADVLVHCTPLGLTPDSDLPLFNVLPIKADQLQGYGIVVDFVYRADGTRLLREAQQRGVRTIDGLELLVGQGALSFEQFTGQAADVGVMSAAARAG
jgi:shikimate dehydrogenase